MRGCLCAGPACAHRVKNRDRDMWSAEEDAQIVSAVMRLGPKWHQISEEMNGRSSNAVRNRFMRCCEGSMNDSTPSVGTQQALTYAQAVAAAPEMEKEEEQEQHSAPASFRIRRPAAE